jgi:hypothetical protein
MTMGSPSNPSRARFYQAVEDETKPGHYNYDKFNGYVDGQGLADHIASMNGLALALKNYGQALIDLANYGDQAARLAVFNDIATKFDTAANNPVSADTAKKFGLVAGTIGNIIIEAVKKKDIKTIEAKYADALNYATGLFRIEFTKGDKDTHTLSYVYKMAICDYRRSLLPLATLHATENAIPQMTNKNVRGFVAAYRVDTDIRNDIVSKLLDLEKMQNRYNAIANQGVKATDSLQSANAKLQDAIANNTYNFDDLKDVVTQVESFYQAFTAIK